MCFEPVIVARAWPATRSSRGETQFRSGLRGADERVDAAASSLGPLFLESERIAGVVVTFLDPLISSFLGFGGDREWTHHP